MAALEFSADSIQKGESAAWETPLAQAELLRTIWMTLRGHKRDAFEYLLSLMKMGRDNAEIRNAMLLILGERKGERVAPFVFGLGTGRSGSTSLTLALGSISNSYFSHEHPSIIPWEDGENVVDYHLARLKAIGTHYSVVGDVSHWWLPYVEYIYKIHPSSLFIFMRRELGATVDSFLKIKGGGKGSLNHWCRHDGTYFSSHYWDKCYPTYENCSTIRQALELYWHDYYQ